MSGEASWIVASKLFSIAILSGVPVWTPQDGAPYVQRLKDRFGPLLPAVEQIIEAQRAPLSLGELDPTGKTAAPGLSAAVIEDCGEPPAKTSKAPKSAPPIRATVHLGARVKSTGEGFNLVLEIHAPVRRTALDDLARSIAATLFPNAKADDSDDTLTDVGVGRQVRWSR